MVKKDKKIEKKKNNKFLKGLSILLMIISIICIIFVYYFKVIDALYFYIGVGVFFALILLFVYRINHQRKLIGKVLNTIIAFIIMLIEIVIILYSIGTINFLDDIFDKGYKIETYGIYSINNKLDDIKKIVVYKTTDESYEKALELLNQKGKFEIIYESDFEDAFKLVINKKVDAIYINENFYNIYLEEYKNNDFKVVETLEVKINKSLDFKEVNVIKNPFIVYFSGVDNTGSVKKSSRSDVNLLAVINPKTGKILIVNTPRDYYITLVSKNAKDKLTHAGIYGVEESAKSLGNLYNIDINYYARVNFTSFIKIIDSLGGIDINVQNPDYRYNQGIDCGKGYVCEQSSDRNSNKIIKFASGNQTLNGEEALAYTRNRYQYRNSDNDRGLHQQDVLKAMMEKASKPSVLTKYNSILKSLSTGLITNVDRDTFSKVANYLLKEQINWKIDAVAVTGSNGYEKTYSTGNAKAYVMIPNEEDVNKVKEKIKTIMEEK